MAAYGRELFFTQGLPPTAPCPSPTSDTSPISSDDHRRRRDANTPNSMLLGDDSPREEREDLEEPNSSFSNFCLCFMRCLCPCLAPATVNPVKSAPVDLAETETPAPINLSAFIASALAPSPPPPLLQPLAGRCFLTIQNFDEALPFSS